MGFSLGGIAGNVGNSLLDVGQSMVLGKYASDLQGHQIDRSAEYDRNQAIEMFNRQVTENQNVFKQNVAQEQAVFDRNKAYANEMWEKEKAYNLEMWNKQNDYNSPSAQMARFKAAGLNPRLIYGQGNPGNATGVVISRPQDVDLNAAVLGSARAEATTRGVVDSGRLFEGALANYVRMRQVGLMEKQIATRNALMEEEVENMRIKNESDRRELGIRKATGTSTGDSTIMRSLAHLWSNLFNPNTPEARQAEAGYLKKKELWEHTGLPESELPKDSFPFPINIAEPAWQGGN